MELTITGDIIESVQKSDIDTEYESNGSTWCSTRIDCYIVELDGNAGKINISKSGGTGPVNSWSTILIY